MISNRGEIQLLDVAKDTLPATVWLPRARENEQQKNTFPLFVCQVATSRQQKCPVELSSISQH